MDWVNELLQKIQKIDELERILQELVVNQKPQYIPLSEWMKKYNIGMTTAWKLRKKGLVDFKKIGKKVYVLDELPK